jgi:hypothetical protein
VPKLSRLTPKTKNTFQNKEFAAVNDPINFGSINSSGDPGIPPPEPPSPPPSNDVNLNVMGSGCLASCSTGCLMILIFVLIGGAMGVQAMRHSGGLVFFGFFAGLLTNLIVGYKIGQSARKHNAPVNFHVIIFGVILMVIGLAGWITPNKQPLSNQMQALVQFVRLVGWILTIPVMLLGASWAEEE